MPLYYVGLENGTCSVFKAMNKQDATSHTRREEGLAHTTNMEVHLATKDEMAHHKRMGGHVYETTRHWEAGKWVSEDKT